MMAPTRFVFTATIDPLRDRTRLTPPKKQIETKVIKGNEAFNEAMFKEDPKPWTKQQILLYCCSLIGFFCSTMNG
jgi:hypothetical protein